MFLGQERREALVVYLFPPWYVSYDIVAYVVSYLLSVRPRTLSHVVLKYIVEIGTISRYFQSFRLCSQESYVFVERTLAATSEVQGFSTSSVFQLGTRGGGAHVTCGMQGIVSATVLI